MYLIPGDSPMGLRLPLDALPWSAPEDRPVVGETDPFTPQPARAPLNAPAALRNQIPGVVEPQPPQRGKSAAGITRTALCVEVRDPQRANGPRAEREHGGRSGVLYVFMPPLQHLEDYLALLQAVEATASEQGVQLCG
jgi:uncharacterized protein (DUF2126 family)